MAVLKNVLPPPKKKNFLRCPDIPIICLRLERLLNKK